MSQLRSGSSPVVSAILPQRASRAKSTMGENVTLIPIASDSLAAISQQSAMVSGENVAPMPIGSG